MLKRRAANRIAIILSLALLVTMVMPGGFDEAYAAKKNAKSVKITNLTSHYTFQVGESRKLSALTTPSYAVKKYSWSSSNPSVVKVSDNGTLKALKKGTATVKVTAGKKGKRKSDKVLVKVGQRIRNIQLGSDGTAVVYKGEKLKITAKVLPTDAANKTLSATSSKSKVATAIQKGTVTTVTPVSNGTTKVSVKATDGSNKTAACMVKVLTHVNDINIKSYSKTCFVGETLDLAASVSPATANDKTITWVSDDESKATVDQNGRVKGKSAGQVYINAVANDDSGTVGSYLVYVESKLNLSHCRLSAHRGVPSQYPENTVASFTAAVSKKYDIVETDIWECTKGDNGGTATPFFPIMHDYSLLRTCGVDLPVTNLTKATMSDYPITDESGRTYAIPLVEDFIDVLKDSNKELVIEIKNKPTSTSISETAAKELIRIIKEKGVYDRTRIFGFSKKSIKTFQNVDTGGGLEYGVGFSLGSVGKWESQFNWCVANGVKTVSIAKACLTQSVIDLAHSKGLEVSVYTVDDKNIAADFIRMGVDCINTDVPLGNI